MQFLAPRRLVDVSKVDMSTEILGVKYDTPIIIAPVSGQRAFHSGGEIAVAKAAKVGNHLEEIRGQAFYSRQYLSTRAVCFFKSSSFVIWSEYRDINELTVATSPPKH